MGLDLQYDACVYLCKNINSAALGISCNDNMLRVVGMIVIAVDYDQCWLAKYTRQGGFPLLPSEVRRKVCFVSMKCTIKPNPTSLRFTYLSTGLPNSTSPFQTQTPSRHFFPSSSSHLPISTPLPLHPTPPHIPPLNPPSSINPITKTC
jgi:hypothetical protein